MFFVINAREWQSSDEADRVWRRLWDLRDVVSVAIPTVVSSPCSLLAEEHADTLCLSTGMQVPLSSAWVSRQVDLASFTRANGDIRLAALEETLVECVDSGDAMHDAAGWDNAGLRSDSRLNRRLAIAVSGWGTLVALRGANPAEFATLTVLEQLARHVREILETRSRVLAAEHGHCPVLDLEGVHIGRYSDELMARWQSALADSAVRHRNLLMLSPWDVFPRGQPADLRYMDLLPLLRSANSLSFQRDVDIGHWNANEFRGFYERISAILAQGDEAGLIAKQV